MGGLADLTFEKSYKLGDSLFYSVIISRLLRIFTPQNRFQSLCDEIFNIDRFLDELSSLWLKLKIIIFQAKGAE